MILSRDGVVLCSGVAVELLPQLVHGFLREPASAASVAGLIKLGAPADATVVCVLTGHGLKDPDIAISQIAVPTPVDAEFEAVRAELGL